MTVEVDRPVGIDIVVANELIERRANLYKILYPKCNMICGDITNENIFNKIISSSENIEFLIA